MLKLWVSLALHKGIRDYEKDVRVMAEVYFILNGVRVGYFLTQTNTQIK